MLFNSYEFILVFLPIVLIVYYLLCHFRLTQIALGALVLASLFFYAFWDVRYLPLLLGSITFNYCLGRHIETSLSKTWLAVGITTNLGLLGYFKYFNFFIENINHAFGLSIMDPHIILPLGISFFTFTQIAYLVDTYRGETKGYSLLSYSLFVTIFPHLIAGPILYHKHMIPQFSDEKNFAFSHENFSRGCFLFTIGLTKKVLIADNIARWAKPIFDNPEAATWATSWVAALSYTFQLYFDFSGYSDMAIGLGLVFNFVLPVNFNSPYAARSIIDFWRRWHITLSAFLKNYLYIPLGGNRTGHHLRNLMITMLLGGLWHGAGWTFVIWGGLHGVYLMINHMWRKLAINLPEVISWVFTFVAVVVAWVFFRAASVTDAMTLLKTMFGLKGYVLQGGSQIGYLIVLAGIAAWGCNSQELMDRFKPSWYAAVIAAIVFVFCLAKLNKVSEFLYFQF